MGSAGQDSNGVFPSNTMDIYVGNLPYSATEEELGALFAPFGPVKRVTLVKDRETGRPKGFGFVSLADESQVNGAIEAINGAELGGRLLKANASEPKPRREPGTAGHTGGGSGGGKPFKGGGKSVKGGDATRRDRSNDYGDDGFRDKRGGGKPKRDHRDKHRRPKDDFGDW